MIEEVQPERLVSVVTEYLISFLNVESRRRRQMHGVLPLVEGCGAPTAVTLLREILERNEVDLQSMEGAHLSADDDPEEAIRTWMMESFFVEHVADRTGVPIVWHIASSAGGYQALVYGPRFGAKSIKWIRRRHLSSLKKGANRVLNSTDDAETTYRMSRFLEELEEFDQAMDRWLDAAKRERSARQSSSSKSDQQQDELAVRLALLQDLELLSHRVLGPEELRRMTLSE